MNATNSWNPIALYHVLRASWSIETGRKWIPENAGARPMQRYRPCRARCPGGGEILKTEIDGEWHFYNRIGRQRWDLTVSQFETPIGYDDLPATRDEAMAGTSPENYRARRDRVAEAGQRWERSRLPNDDPRPSPVQPKLIIFDCDGVLVDSEVLACRNVSECLGVLGIDLPASEVISRYVGISDQTMLEDLRRQFGHLIPLGFAETLQDTLIERFETELKPIRGVKGVLRTIPVPVCLASSSPPERINYCLTVTGLTRYFNEENIFSSVQVRRGKPAPDLFLFAAEAMSVRPTECVVIEDSIPGVTAAVAAGMRCIGFAGGGHCQPGHAAQLFDAGAWPVLTEMRALPRTLLDLAGRV